MYRLSTINSPYYGFEVLFRVFIIMALIAFIMCVLCIVCSWVIFRKAGKNGWESLIPFYNIIVLLEIVELPSWYLALFFLPFANIYFFYKVARGLADKFSSGEGNFWLLLFFLPVVGLPILAFDKNRVYQDDEDALVAEALQRAMAEQAAKAQPTAPAQPAQPTQQPTPTDPTTPPTTPAQ